ncbi:MAG: apolipoprotein N-acyltransferase [Methylophilales bacterium]|nr:apolipoprotein N-acyltransferase [Methylophilales bacterium]
MRLRQFLLAIALGAFAVLGYAPFYFYPATILALAGLFWLIERSPSPRQAGLLGLSFGAGLFGVGISWLYISLHDFGEMPALLAALATTAVCGFVALFPAATAWLVTRQFPAKKLIALPLLWALLEWVRSWIFTGFPWLTVGYSQVPYSPLAGLVPVVGVYGVSLAMTICAALIAAALCKKISVKQMGVWLLMFWLGGSVLKHLEWSTPQGKPLTFSLLQGNISQSLKWQKNELPHTLQTYLDMLLASHAQLIVIPEMALPQLAENLPKNYLKTFEQHAAAQGGNVLVGIPESATKDGETVYFNAVTSLGAAPSQSYQKSHLVPFGEFIPFKSLIGWIYDDVLHIPLADLERGTLEPQPMNLSGQKIALNICYEDVFGEEIIRQLPAATLLVNVSNDAWYGQSLAAEQHLQMSQTRALETARAVLRSTNTGVTAVINRDGRVLAKLPQFTQASLNGQIQGYQGTTPYVLWGNWLVITLILLALGALWQKRKQS